MNWKRAIKATLLLLAALAALCAVVWFIGAYPAIVVFFGLVLGTALLIFAWKAIYDSFK